MLEVAKSNTRCLPLKAVLVLHSPTSNPAPYPLSPFFITLNYSEVLGRQVDPEAAWKLSDLVSVSQTC